MTVNSIPLQDSQQILSIEERHDNALQKIVDIQKKQIEEIRLKDGLLDLQRLEIKRLRGANKNQVRLAEFLKKELDTIQKLFEQLTVGEE